MTDLERQKSYGTGKPHWEEAEEAEAEEAEAEEAEEAEAEEAEEAEAEEKIRLK